MCPPVTVYLTPVPETENDPLNPFEESFSISQRTEGSASPLPEYKEIFEKMFRLIDVSRRPDYRGAVPEH